MSGSRPRAGAILLAALPLALAEEKGVMVFSGSAVVDWKNSSKFGRGGRPPLVAAYTAHYADRPLQNQHLAYSNDRGRTWTRHAGNPVLDIGQKDFRDPKVFWHAASERWVMAVAWPQEKKIRFYASSDLKSWSHLTDFGPAGATGAIWECPDLFRLPVEGAPRETRWVLIVNLNPGGPSGGSGSQYFVGDFDGRQFVLDPGASRRGAAGGDAPLWLDHGPDLYAAVTWSDVPEHDGRRIALGWISNWEYAQEVPTSPWRSAMTVPRVLTLRRTPEGLRVFQQPVKELERLRRGAPRRFAGGTFSAAAAWLAGQAPLPPLLDVEVTLSGVTAATPFTLALETGPGERTSISCDPARSRLAVDRTRSRRVGFHRAFAGRHEAPLRLADGPAGCGSCSTGHPSRSSRRTARPRWDRYLWGERAGLYFDYNFQTSRRRPYEFSTTFYPLWAGQASPAQAARVLANLDRFEAPSGVRTSNPVWGNQWDAPFGWAPLQMIAVAGLRNYGHHEAASRLARRFIARAGVDPRPLLAYPRVRPRSLVCGGEPRPGVDQGRLRQWAPRSR